MKHLLLCALLLISTAANANNCVKTGSVCVDTSPTKVVGTGMTVTLAQAGGCWKYQDTYTCLQPNAVDYCQPFESVAPACWQTSSVCNQQDTLMNTGCMQYTQTYQCKDNAIASTPPNTTQLDSTYTLVSSDYNTAACAINDGNNNCSIASSTCTSTTPATPLPAGISSSSVAPDGCYQKTQTYACIDGTMTTDCAQYSSNPNCSQSSSTTVNSTPNGVPLVTQSTYQCVTAPATSTTSQDCSGTTFCAGGNCVNTGSPADQDLGLAATMVEAVREGGVYSQGGATEIFSGVDNSCRIRLFGTNNCCSSKVQPAGNFSNQAVLGAAIQVGGEVLQTGSKYVYDALFYDSPDFIQKGLSSLVGSPTLSSFTPSVGIYGISISYNGFAALPNTCTLADASAATNTVAAAGTTAAGTAGATATSSIFSSLSATYHAADITGPIGSTGFSYSFNYYQLAAELAITIYEDLSSCNQQEQMLGMKRGQNLCSYVGTYCSTSMSLIVGSVCVENTQTYCCYNGLLPKIINEQGRVQIGKSYGSVSSPDCSGFTEAEISQIDWSKIDLSEFTAQLMQSMVLPQQNGSTQNISGVVQQQIQNFYQQEGLSTSGK